MNNADRSSPAIELTVCICTRNRPQDLETSLASVRLSSVPVRQIIVSDDSTDFQTRELIRDRYADVEYLEGPRLGLCANRNRALAAAVGTHVLFIDDDATLGQDFVLNVQRALDQVPVELRMYTIVSGLERNRGQLVHPNDQNFLGYQRREYREDEPVNTVVINAAIFPTGLFDRIGFDTNLIYGYDEVDLTTRAVALGYRIVLCRNAINGHFPSLVNRDYYEAHLSASRLYVTIKRYAFTRRAYGRAALFSFVAPIHLVASLIKRNGISGVSVALASLLETAQYISAYVRLCPDRAAIRHRKPPLPEVVATSIVARNI